MDYFAITTILVVLSAAFGYINIRFLKLPDTIGLMLITIVFTLAIFALSYFDTLKASISQRPTSAKLRTSG